MFAGIDFGTSNSSIAIFNGEKLRMFDIEPRHINPRVLPSYTFVTKNHEASVGVEAVEKYIELETGRPSVWEKRRAGQVEITVGGPGSGPIVYDQDLIVEVDIAAKGRLLQSVKTALRNPNYEGTRIFDRFYRIEDLISLLLASLRERYEQVAGESVRKAVIGRPVRFSPDEITDRRAEEKLRQAAKIAGFDEVVFELEPVGAAYLYHQNAVENENVLVFDFGGGTLDMTIMEVGGSGSPQTIATQGVLLGGDDMNASLMYTLLPFFGEGAVLDNGYPFPSHIFDKLFSWQNMVELSRPEYEKLYRQAERGSDPVGIGRLETLVRHKLGFKLFQKLEEAKIDLSSNLYTRFDFGDQGMNLRNTITRGRFEDLLKADVRMVEKALDELMLKGGLKGEQINAVLRTGGSSAIPVFIEVLAKRFGREQIKEMNPFTSIVGGLAIKGYELGHQNK